MMAIVSVAAAFAWPGNYAYADDCDGCALCATSVEKAMDELKSVEKYVLKDEIREAETRLKQADVLLDDAAKQCTDAEAKESISDLAGVSKIFRARISCSLNVDKAVEKEKSAFIYFRNQNKTEGVRLLREAAGHLAIAVDKCSGEASDAARKLMTGVIREYEDWSRP